LTLAISALAGSRFERFFAAAAPPVPAKQKSALVCCSGGCKRHAEHQNLVRQRQFVRSKSSNIQHSKTRALVTWWLLPAAKNTFFVTNFPWVPLMLAQDVGHCFLPSAGKLSPKIGH